MMPSTVPLLDTSSVGDYLQERGVLAEPPSTVTRLSGGVSNVVLLAETATRRVVVKQALEKLLVAGEWHADRSRSHNEATALGLLHRLTPESVPAVLDDDPDRFALVIDAAPAGWATWKDELMAGVIQPWVASWLGGVLRQWHVATSAEPLPPNLETTRLFHQLRIAPYLDTAAERRPDLAAALTRHREVLVTRRTCVVVGDFSPKNVLVGANAGWVIDHEVAHGGDPTFDVAFMLSHLLLKAVHLPAHADALRGCAEDFLRAYGDGPGTDDSAHLCGVTGCLLLARVVGQSPATYLRTAEAARVEQGAAEILHARPDDMNDVWELVVPA